MTEEDHHADQVQFTCSRAKFWSHGLLQTIGKTNVSEQHAGRDFLVMQRYWSARQNIVVSRRIFCRIGLNELLIKGVG